MSQAQKLHHNLQLMHALRQLVQAAGTAVMTIYAANDLGIRQKKDQSPVTQADLTAHHILTTGLQQLTPALPVVSEEDLSSLQVPKQYPCYWLIDPLDGTKEFINRNGQFTINMALIENQYPSYGLVGTPINRNLYWGGTSFGCWRQRGQQVTQLHTQPTASPPRVVASKSHLNQVTSDFIKALGDTTLVQAGSSLKFIRIAEGQADIYPRMAPTCEWDTAAAQAILEGAGGRVTQTNGSPLGYSKATMLNPHFIAWGDGPMPGTSDLRNL